MSDANISGQDVTVETADGPMRLYEAKPPGEARGAIVVVQEAFGVNPHIEDVTRRAAAAGYHAVAPDFFHRSGPGAVVEYGQFEQVMEYFQALGSDDRDPRPTSTPRSATSARRGLRRQPHRARRLLLRRPGVVPRRAAARARRVRSASTAAASSPDASRSSRRSSARSRRCRRRGSGCSATRTARFPSTTSSSCAPRCATANGRHRDRALRRRRSRLPLRPAARLPGRRRGRCVAPRARLVRVAPALMPSRSRRHTR